MHLSSFAERAERLATEPADLATTATVATLFADAGEDLPVVTRFLLGRVFPAHDARTLDVGPALCHEAIARAAGPNVTTDDVERRLAERGEIGAVAADYEFGGQRGLAAFGRENETDALTVAEVDRRLRELAAADGEGSESRKLDVLFGLFNRTDPAEAKLLARLVLGEMRLGVGEGTVRDAIAAAFLSDPDQAEVTDDADPTVRAADESIAAVERALQVTNDYGHVAVLARDEGSDGLRAERLIVGRPVQAMLAQAGTATEAVDAFGTVGVETKFDGARVQIHYVPANESDRASASETDRASASETAEEGLGPRIYSRNMDDVTDALPEIVETVAEAVDVPVILDGEVIAVDDDGDPLPFQEVLRRFRRKHDVDRMRETVTLRLHAFDCLHADGEDLLDEPLRRRHRRLAGIVPTAAADLRTADDVAAIERIETAALESGHEGIMLKDPDSAYTPGDRGRSWLKRKPDVETIDAAVVGAEWGEGRRAELFGTFLLGVRDGDDYETIGKVATGISDEELAALTDRLEPHVVEESGTTVRIRPAVVLEVGYEEIQQSPTYSAGYALRFPRFVGVREDRTVDDVDTVERVERLAPDEDDRDDGTA